MPDKPTTLTKLPDKLPDVLPDTTPPEESEDKEKWRKSLFGRKTKLTDNTTIAVVANLKRGLSIRETCNIVGISETSFYDWRNQHADFSDIVEQAQYEAIKKHRANIDQHAKRDWRASAWTLERTHPNEYAPKSTVAMTGNVGVTIKLDPTGYQPNGDK